MAAKRPPKMKADPLARVTAARKAATAASRKPTVKGTFTHGTKSASSSNAGVKGSASKLTPKQSSALAKKNAAGGGQRRDRKGRFT
jgi:hypothetical protein